MSLPARSARFGPARALAAAILLTGVAVIGANLGDADDSLGLGVALLYVGLAGLVLRETAPLRRALEITAVLALVLAGGEAMVRRENGIAARAYAERTMHFVDDPWLRYEMKPDISCGEGTTNAQGMLDVPRTLAKPPGTLRVACLGDSVGGDCSLPRDNACAALEPILREARRGRPVEVLNFSVPGYNTMQEARALELKALPFAPDAVVVLYVVNDPYPDLAVSHFLPGHFKFEHLLWSGAQIATGKLLGSDPLADTMGRLYESPRSWDGVVVRGFDRIRAATEPRGLPVAVAVFPLFVERSRPALGAIYAKVAREAEAHGFVGVDLSRAAFADAPVEELLKPSRDVIHPNAKAHLMAATAIARALLARHPELSR
jgi:hypothetical protein